MQYSQIGGRSAGPRLKFTAVLVAALLLAAACGKSSKNDGGGAAAASPDVTKPASQDVTTGGKLVYGVEAETSGWDPTSDRWAISGYEVVFSIYDPLSAYDADGNIKPYLAESFVPNADFTQWTINLRPNIKFHNGEPLTAAATAATMQGIKDSALTGGAFKGINQISTVPGNDLAVSVTMKQPWASFPATLTGQAGIVIAPSQMNAGSPDKSRKPIGTGPFEYESWTPDSQFVAKRNPNYWMKDDQGKQLPYLDEVEFRPIPDVQTRQASLQSNDISMMHTSQDQFINSLNDLAKSGQIQARQDRGENEEAFVMLNSSAPPFDNIIARQAVAYATDVDTWINTFQINPANKTNSPFGKSSPFYADSAYPTFDQNRARDLVQQYKDQTGQDLAFNLGSTNDPNVVAGAQLLQQQWQSVGMQVSLRQTEQGQYITDAVQGKYQANLWRQFGATDPDADYVWWHKDNAEGAITLNIARFANDDVSKALDIARGSPDPAVRKEQYAKVQQVWGEQVPYVWLNTTTWLIAAQNDVRHFWNNALPDQSNVASIPPLPYQSGSHRLTQTWIDTNSQ